MSDGTQSAQLDTIKAVAPQSARTEQPARLQLVNGSYTLVSTETPDPAPSANAAGSHRVQQQRPKPFRFPAVQPRRKAAEPVLKQAQQPGDGKTPTTAQHVRPAPQLEPQLQRTRPTFEASPAEHSEDHQRQAAQAVHAAPAECAATPATQPTSAQQPALALLSATVIQEMPNDPPADRRPKGASHMQHPALSAAQPAAIPGSTNAAPVPSDKQPSATDGTIAAADAAAESSAMPGPPAPASATAAAAAPPASSAADCGAEMACTVPPHVTAATAASGPPRKQRRAGRNGPATCAAKGQAREPAAGQHAITSSHGDSTVLAKEAEHVVCSSPAAEAGEESKPAEAADMGPADAGHAAAACSLSRIGRSTDIAQPEPVLMPQTPPLMPEAAASRRKDVSGSSAAVSNVSSVPAGNADPAQADTNSQGSPNAAPAQEQIDKVTCLLLPMPTCCTGLERCLLCMSSGTADCVGLLIVCRCAGRLWSAQMQHIGRTPTSSAARSWT